MDNSQEMLMEVVKLSRGYHVLPRPHSGGRGKQCTMQQRGHRNISAGLISPTDGRTIKSKGDVSEERRAVVVREASGCVDLPLPTTKQMREAGLCKTVEFLIK